MKKILIKTFIRVILCISIAVFLSVTIIMVPDTLRAYEVSNSEHKLISTLKFGNYESLEYIVTTRSGPIKLKVVITKPEPFESAGEVYIHTYDINGKRYFNWKMTLWFAKDRYLGKFIPCSYQCYM